MSMVSLKALFTKILQNLNNKGMITIRTHSLFSELPLIIEDRRIKESHLVVRELLSNPYAQTGDWIITTYNGYLEIDSPDANPITDSTDIILYLLPSIEYSEYGVVVIKLFDVSSLPVTILDTHLTERHLVVRYDLSNSKAQTNDWDVECSDGSLTIKGVNAINGTTDITLYLVLGAD